MKRIFFMIIMLILLVGGCATGKSVVKPGVNFAHYKRVAILPFEYRGRGEQIPAEDYFEQELIEKGYSIVERRRIQAILDELRFQQSDLTNQEKTAQIGKFLNVDAILSAVISISSKVSGSSDLVNVDISAKLTSVEEASILWSGSASNEGGGLLGAIGGIGKVLVQDTKISGEVKRVVKKICEKIPVPK